MTLTAESILAAVSMNAFAIGLLAAAAATAELLSILFTVSWHDLLGVALFLNPICLFSLLNLLNAASIKK